MGSCFIISFLINLEKKEFTGTRIFACSCVLGGWEQHSARIKDDRSIGAPARLPPQPQPRGLQDSGPAQEGGAGSAAQVHAGRSSLARSNRAEPTLSPLLRLLPAPSAVLLRHRVGGVTRRGERAEVPEAEAALSLRRAGSAAGPAVPGP